MVDFAGLVTRDATLLCMSTDWGLLERWEVGSVRLVVFTALLCEPEPVDAAQAGRETRLRAGTWLLKTQLFGGTESYSSFYILFHRKSFFANIVLARLLYG